MEPALKQRLIGADGAGGAGSDLPAHADQGPRARKRRLRRSAVDCPMHRRANSKPANCRWSRPAMRPSGGAVGMDPRQAGDSGQLGDRRYRPRHRRHERGRRRKRRHDAGTPPPPAITRSVSAAMPAAADAPPWSRRCQRRSLPGIRNRARPAAAAPLYRVRIGPFATRAEAEAARLRAAHVRDDVGATVVVLDADADTVARAQHRFGVAADRCSDVVGLGRRGAARVQAGAQAESSAQAGRGQPADRRPAQACGRPKPVAPRNRRPPVSVLRCSWVRSAAPPRPTSCATARAPRVSALSSRRCAPTRAR